MAFAAWTVAALFFVDASAFRSPSKRSAPQIDGIFAIAAAGSAEPGLVNPRGGPCFPGLRSATVKMQWYGQDADLATTVAGVIGFRHPLMDFKLIDVEDQSRSTLYSCTEEGEEVTNRPRGFPSISLHNQELYQDSMRNMDLGWGDLLHKVITIGVPQSFNHDRTSAQAAAQEYGWTLIGSAYDEGNTSLGDNIWVGESVSHLFQEPRSKNCMLTFKGTKSIEDWAGNIQVDKVSFCGYAGVHKGFRDAVMTMVKNNEWQNDVRTNLSRCSKVYTVGYSAGGSEAELFGACVQQAPQGGQDGYDDYRYIGW